MARRSVWQLTTAGFLLDRALAHVGDAAVLVLSQRGYRALVTSRHIRNLPRMDWPSFARRVHKSDLILRHELTVMDVRCARCFKRPVAASTAS